MAAIVSIHYYQEAMAGRWETDERIQAVQVENQEGCQSLEQAEELVRLERAGLRDRRETSEKKREMRDGGMKMMKT